MLMTDGEERFLLVERRLRDCMVRALRSTTIVIFVSGLETLLEAFTLVRSKRGGGWKARACGAFLERLILISYAFCLFIHYRDRIFLNIFRF